MKNRKRSNMSRYLSTLKRTLSTRLFLHAVVELDFRHKTDNQTCIKSQQKSTNYSETISYIQTELSFVLLCSCIFSMRCCTIAAKKYGLLFFSKNIFRGITLPRICFTSFFVCFNYCLFTFFVCFISDDNGTKGRQLWVHTRSNCCIIDLGYLQRITAKQLRISRCAVWNSPEK